MRVFLLSLSLLLDGSYAQLDPAKASLLTGTLRPGLYFGISSRVPQSLLTGIMWLGAHNYDGASR